MNSLDLTDVLEKLENPEATVIRVRSKRLVETERLNAVRDALYREAERANGPLILDLGEVEFLSSASLGWLITLRRKLMQRGSTFQAPCRRRGLFAFFKDSAEALQAIRNGESDPLLLCGVSEEMMEIFQVC